MRVLGVDPGSLKCGFGIVDFSAGRMAHVSSGTISLRGPIQDRLLELTQALEQVVALHRPDVAAIEGVFHATNAKSALVLGQARGAVLVTLARLGLECGEYPPAQVKQMVASSGRADKAQVQHMVRSLLGLTEKLPFDTSDALSIAICHSLVLSTPENLREVVR